MTKIDELRWVRVFTPSHIPRYLIDQIKNKEYSTDDFYSYLEKNCLMAEHQELRLNPLNHLYVMVTPENIVKGALWFTVNPLTKDVFLEVYAVDKEYWEKGQAVKKAKEFIEDIVKKADLKKIIWATAYEKHSMKHGFKRSKFVLMEYNPWEEKKVGKKENKSENHFSENKNEDKKAI